MPAKETQQHTSPKTEEVSAVKVPATGLDATAVVGTPTAEAPAPSQTRTTPGRKMRGDNARRGGRGSGGERRGNRGEPRERVKPEFDSKIIDIRRVTRVTAGGRRMNFSVSVVAGDRKGRVGVGLGKGSDTASAVEKATREAKKNLIKIPLSAKMIIPHAVEGKHGSALVKIFPARGRGVVAGSSARAVIELAGITDVCAKYLSGSKNRLNNARAAIEALKNLSLVKKAELRANTR